MYATFDDCSRVAAHVHCDTMWQAIHPELIVRPAEPKCSLEWESEELCSILASAKYCTIDTKIANTAVNFAVSQTLDLLR